MAEEPQATKGERRQRKRESRRKMRVIGRSVRLLMDIVRRRAERVAKRPLGRKRPQAGGCRWL
ncbi:MAG: hypothetical protein O7D33_04685 [Chloroflexi bacterium]|nr:hypothetical protein [Chloroflexota bacterium]